LEDGTCGGSELFFVGVAAGLVGDDVVDAIFLALFQALLIVRGVLRQSWQDVDQFMFEGFAAVAQAQLFIDLIHLSVFGGFLLAVFEDLTGC
jgi:hypothetical protein